MVKEKLKFLVSDKKALALLIVEMLLFLGAEALAIYEKSLFTFFVICGVIVINEFLDAVYLYKVTHTLPEVPNYDLTDDVEMKCDNNRKDGIIVEMEEYAEYLCTNKEFLGLTWQNIADEITDEFGVTHDESYYRLGRYKK